VFDFYGNLIKYFQVFRTFTLLIIDTVDKMIEKKLNILSTTILNNFWLFNNLYGKLLMTKRSIQITITFKLLKSDLLFWVNHNKFTKYGFCKIIQNIYNLGFIRIVYISFIIDNYYHQK